MEEIIMAISNISTTKANATTTINLRDFYSWYTHDEYVEVSNEIAEELFADKRYHKSHEQRIRRNMAFYSLDRDDGIETAATITNHSDNPEHIFTMMERHCDLCQALNSLPEIQGRRIEAHYLLGKSQAEIAQTEGVSTMAVSKSISKGLAAMKIFIKNFDKGVYFCPQSEAGI